MMKRSVPPLLVVALILAFVHSGAQDKVDFRAVTPGVKLEEVVAGHLIDLNGKYKFRATEVVIEPGGYLGPPRPTTGRSHGSA